MALKCQYHPSVLALVVLVQTVQLVQQVNTEQRVAHIALVANMHQLDLNIALIARLVRVLRLVLDLALVARLDFIRQQVPSATYAPQVRIRLLDQPNVAPVFLVSFLQQVSQGV